MKNARPFPRPGHAVAILWSLLALAVLTVLSAAAYIVGMNETSLFLVEIGTDMDRRLDDMERCYGFGDGDSTITHPSP